MIKDRLLAIRKISRALPGLEEEIDTLYASIDAIKSASDFSVDFVHGGKNESPVERYVVKRVERLTEIAEIYERIDGEIAELKPHILKLSDLEFLVVTRYYLEGMSLRQVGASKGVNYSHEKVRQINGEAVRHLREIVGEI